MRKRIIILFFILLLFQAAQIAAVSYSIRYFQSAVNRVALTVEGREVSRSTSFLLDQTRSDAVLIAGMNSPGAGLTKFRDSWQAFDQRLQAMYTLADKLAVDPEMIDQLKKNIATSAEKKAAFEKIILDDSPDESHTPRIHDAAFELDGSIENSKNILDVVLSAFAQKEKLAVRHEQKFHNLPIEVVSIIGIAIGIILCATGYFAVTRIVNPLVDLTKKYQVAMQRFKKEQQMTLALEKARASVQAKSNFLANMSHELRTPMNAVLGFSQLLNDTRLEGKQKKYLDLIISSGRHLVQIINDILDFSKLEAGKITLESLDFNLEKVINEVVKISATRMAENPLDLYIDYPDDLPRHVKSDPTRFKQVLVNLMSNAIKFTTEGEVGIIVRRDNHIDHREDEIPLQISVKDSGIGIKKDTIGKIFDSFTQVDESATRRYGGTGLGLTITKSIVEAMGGRIWAESLEGKGSRFTFAMNVKKGKPVDPWVIDEDAKKLLAGKKVFIIDDNPIALKVIKKTCESVDMAIVSVVDSGKAALTLLESLARTGIVPDIILCDIMMSEMHGYEVAQKLRTDKRFARIKIIAVTKISESDVVHYIRDDCFNAYLTKPVAQVELINCLAKELGYRPSKDPAQREKITPVDIGAAGLEGTRILVAENNITNFMLLKECLENFKCDVDYTYNGEEAIERLESREYDLCLIDLHMPVINGIEVAKTVRQRISKTLPIIALTAAVLKEDRLKAQRAGMNDFLEKPLDIIKLKEKILQYAGVKKPAPEDTRKDNAPIKALVVDDNPLNMRLLLAFLKKMNFAGDTAVNGKEAVEKIRKNKYDICFMDIQMPVMGGVEATKIIREEISKDLPIIAVTAVTGFTPEKSLEAGMNDFIGKPVDQKKLKDVILKHCSKPV